jgi:hypothetical protein
MGLPTRRTVVTSPTVRKPRTSTKQAQTKGSVNNPSRPRSTRVGISAITASATTGGAARVRKRLSTRSPDRPLDRLGTGWSMTVPASLRLRSAHSTLRFRRRLLQFTNPTKPRSMLGRSRCTVRTPAVGPRWVRSRRANKGQRRTRAVTGRSPNPQVPPPTAH